MQLIKAGDCFHVFYVDRSGDDRWLDTLGFTIRDFILDSDDVVVAVRPRTVS
jgi:hypothetical protein